MKAAAAPWKTQLSTNRDILKQATEEAHACAEARWFSSGSFASRPSYDGWLSSLYFAHEALGQSATRFDALKRYALEETRRRNALVRDLGGRQQQWQQPARHSESWSWGVLYALNGSALGASVLLKTGAIQASWPTHYVEEMRNFATSGGLAAFFQSLNDDKLNATEIVCGAHSVFDALVEQNSDLGLAT